MIAFLPRANGRLSRKAYLLRVLAIFLLWNVPLVIFVEEAIHEQFYIFGIQITFELTALAAILSFIAFASAGARRFHDLGLSGLPAILVVGATFLGLIPTYLYLGSQVDLTPYPPILDTVSDIAFWPAIIVQILLVVVGFIPGDRKSNRFGPPYDQVRSLRIQRRLELRELRFRTKYNSRPSAFGKRTVYRIRELFSAGLLHTFLLSKCLRIIGYILTILGLLTVLRPRYWIDLAQQDLATAILSIVFVIAVFSSGLLFLGVSRRLRQKITNYDILRVVNEGASFILFLRPFRGDRSNRIVPAQHSSTSFYPPTSLYQILYILVSNWLTFWKLFRKKNWNAANFSVNFQEFLTRELRSVAPLVGLGVHDIGVAKVATPDSSWEDKFRFLAKAASCILYIPADSSGSLTEFEEIINTYLSKTVFISVPHDDSIFSRLEFWRFDYSTAWKNSMRIMHEKFGHGTGNDGLDRYAPRKSSHSFYHVGHLLKFDKFPDATTRWLDAKSLLQVVKSTIEQPPAPSCS